MRPLLLTLFLLVLTHAPVGAQTPADTLLARRYYQTADSLTERGEYQEANQWLQRAQRIYQETEDWEQYVACLNSISYNFSELSILDSAMAIAQQASQTGKHYLDPDHPELGRTYYVLGLAQLYEGEYNKSLDYGRRALEICKQHYGEHHPQAANAYDLFGLNYIKLGEYQQALTFLQRALTIRKSAYPNAHTLVAESYLNIGTVYFYRQEYDKSLAYDQEALSIYQKLFGEVHPQIAMSYNNLGLIHRYKEEYDQAFVYYQKSIALNHTLFGDTHLEIAVTYNNIGVLHHEEKKYDQAVIYYQKALAIYKELVGEEASDTGVLYNNIGTAYENEESYHQALAYYKRGLAIYERAFGEVNSGVAAAFNKIGRIYYKQQEYVIALSAHRQSLIANGLSLLDTSVYTNPSLEHYHNGNQLLLTLEYKAKTLMALQVDSLAYRTYLVADSLLKQLNRSYSTRGDKIALASTAKQLYEGAIQTALQRYHATQDTTYLHTAFYFAERSKAGVLTEALSTLEARQFGHVPDSVLTLEASLRTDRSLYQSHLSGVDSSRYQSKLFAVNQRYDSLTQVLETEYPNYYQLKYATHTVTVPAIQSQLSAEDGVIAYFVGDSTRYAFVITANHFEAVPLASDTSLDTRLSALRRILHSDSTASTAYQRPAYALYQQLLAPIINDSSLASANHITIIPDGPLGYLPFELLLTEPPTVETNYAQLPYLLRDYRVRYGYSATWLFHPFSRSHQSAVDQYIAFAPDYPPTSPDSTQRLALGPFRSQVGPLRFNRQEASAVHQYLPGVTLTGQKAREQRFKQDAPRYGVIHLAMHALIDDQNPLYSRLVFSHEATDSLEDGYLHAYELYDMELSADLAVLSACETGYGKLERGEGIMSLARAFAYAGCPSIVMSHWLVDDAASAQLMDAFYRHLSEGLPKDEALRQAKLAYLETASVQKAHPFFWSNFVLIGDAVPIVEAPGISIPGATWVYVLGGLLLLFGATYGYKRQRRRVDE